MNRPYTVRGSAPKEAEKLVITILSDRAEILWDYTDYECTDPNHQRVTGTEVLPADYFATHTVGDFIRFLNEQPWGNVFVYQINRADRLRALFSRN